MLRSRRGLSPTMIGRADELHTLAALADQARADAGPTRAEGPAIALVSGAAGVGKTRLLRELVALIGSTHAGALRVFAGQAQPASLGQPYQVARELLGSAAPSVPGARPGDGGALGPSTVATALCDAILASIAGAPALVLVEDLHWADAGSVAVLSQLAATAGPSVVVVLTYRPEETTQRLPGGELIAHLERVHPVTKVTLEPLRRADVGAFLASVYGRSLPTSAVDTLMARTGGNPFFLEELVHAAGCVDPERLGDQPLPWSLADLVARELDGVGTAERQVIETIAVVGNRAPFGVLEIVTGFGEATLVGHLRSLVTRGLLVEEGDDDFSFRHALVGDAIQHQLLGRERRRLHAVVLDALRTTGSCDLAGLAHHAAGAARWDDLLTLAREGVPHYLERGAPHQALRLATEALPEAPDDRGLLAGAARAAWLAGAPREAIVHAERWRDVARRDGDSIDEAAALRLLCRLYHEAGDERRKAPLVAELAARAEAAAPGEERARLLAAVAQAHMLADDVTLAVTFAEAALAEADAADAKAVQVQAKVELGSALARVPDRLDEGERVLRDGIDDAEALGDWVLASRGLHNLMGYVRAERSDDDVPPIVGRLEQAAAKSGFEVMTVLKPMATRCDAAIARGELAEARRHAQAMAALPGAGPYHHHLNGEWHRALLAAEGGDPASARALHDQLWHAPANEREEAMHWFLPEVARFIGEPAAAVESLGRFTDEREIARCWFEPMAVHLRVEAALVAGAPIVAVDAALDPLRAVGHRFLDGALVPAAGEVALARGDHQRVLDLLGDGTRVLGRPIGDARSRARVQFLRAQALAALGRRGDARDAVAAARVDLARWPGVRAAEVQRLAERLDGGAGTALSGRELEVAAEVAAGRTNAEIARALYIAPKTASVHVSNILAKLALTNRAEIAAWYARRDAAP